MTAAPFARRSTQDLLLPAYRGPFSTFATTATRVLHCRVVSRRVTPSMINSLTATEDRGEEAHAGETTWMHGGYLVRAGKRASAGSPSSLANNIEYFDIFLDIAQHGRRTEDSCILRRQVS